MSPLEQDELAKKITQLRKEAGRTQTQLAQDAGLTTSMLNQIEKGKATPSIQSLKSIAKALDTPVFTFLMEQHDASELIVRKEERRQMMIDGIHYELLSPDFTSTLVTAIMRLSAGAASSDSPLSHRGEEVAYVMQGPIELTLEGTTHILQAGDSVKIPPFAEHMYRNHSQAEVSILFSVTPPAF